MGFPSQFTDDPAPATSDPRREPSGGRAAAALFAVVAALLAATLAGLLAAGGDGRVLEFSAIGIGLLLAYAARGAFGAVVAVGLGATLLALEAHYGRLDGDHVAGALALTGAGAAAALASGHLRDRFDAWNAVPAKGPQPSHDESHPAVEAGSLAFAVHRALGSSEALSLLLVRPDGLVDLGEREGREATRAVLNRVSAVVRAELGAAGQLLRHSLFDFWVILPDTTVEAARATAERIRLGLHESQVDVDWRRRVRATLSVGVAASPRDGETARSLLEAAQRALGAAVELGGNRTVLHSLPPGAPRGWGLHYDPAALDAEAQAEAGA